MKNLYEIILSNAPRDISECSYEELYFTLSKTVDEIKKIKIENMPSSPSKKKGYYVCAEFLIGKLLVNNMINLGIYEEVNRFLSEHGKDINKIEEYEIEPSLGNGGLGRLAACFLDSAATLELNLDGIGLCYHNGLFKQKFTENSQNEIPDKWIGKSYALKKTDTTFEVKFTDFSVKATMYDIDIFGYLGRVNKLHLFDIDTIDDSLIKDGISFDKTKIKKNLTLFLYPDDSDEAGKLLRVYQQYFMVSCAAQFILNEIKDKGYSLDNLYDFAVIQINDTHPSLIIPELIRLLCENGIEIDKASEIVSKTVAYTNHTILAEALEKWPLKYIKKVSSPIGQIIEHLDECIKKKYTDKSVHIIDKNNFVHMANMDIHYTFSTNGVAHLHTEILKNTELNSFYKIYPEKFNNKTNGITFRRWLLNANPVLSSFISSLIGDEFKKDANHLAKLGKFTDDKTVLEKLINIKEYNKARLKEFINRNTGVEVDEQAIFDMQIKRLHEYKRQQMNALFLIDRYLEIKNGIIPKRPICAIFGAKAAPAYTLAKDIIHLILCLSEIINNDANASRYLKIVMIENYNVSAAQMLIPACDISEQISLASKEASGTGNMKFMLNGAVTLGTKDGANVEIHNLVGDDNIYIFGDDSKTVIDRYKRKTYIPSKYYETNETIKNAVDFITSNALLSVGNPLSLNRLKNELITKDWFMTFPDFDSYKKVRNRAFCDFEDRMGWAKKMLINIKNAGYFSSDRTVSEYNKDIWKL